MGRFKHLVDFKEGMESFKVFNQPLPPKNVPEEMDIQRKP